MGKSSRRRVTSSDKSRGDLLKRGAAPPPQDAPSSSFTQLLPKIIQFALTWIIVVCSIRVLKAYGLLTPAQQQQEQQDYNTPPSSAIEKIPIEIQTMMSSSDKKNQKPPNIQKTVETSNTNDEHLNAQKEIQQHEYHHKHFQITPELQKQFHPVMKFPTRTIKVKDDDHDDESNNKVRVVKKQLYRVLDFTKEAGSSQLIPHDYCTQKHQPSATTTSKLNPFQSFYIHHMQKNQTNISHHFAIGKYNENRVNLYSSTLFQNTSNEIGGYHGARTIHMGIDLGGPVGTKVYSFWDGIVHSRGYNPDLGDYGFVIVVQYSIPISSSSNNKFTNVWVLYGHLDKSVMKKQVGQNLKRGEVLGRLGSVCENGGWKSPHVHVQLSVTKPETHDMPGAVSLKDRERAIENYPDPRFILGPLY